MRHGNIRCDVFDNVKIKPHWRRYQPNFKIYRHDDRKPDGITSPNFYESFSQDYESRLCDMSWQRFFSKTEKLNNTPFFTRNATNQPPNAAITESAADSKYKESTTLYNKITREYTSASYYKCSRKELIYYMVKKTTS